MFLPLCLVFSLSEVFTQRLDHFSSRTNATFDQTYYLKTAPTQTSTYILVVGGWESFDASLLESPAVSELATLLNAHVVGLEHR
jgi:hypothetical protein